MSEGDCFSIVTRKIANSQVKKLSDRKSILTAAAAALVPLVGIIVQKRLTLSNKICC